MKEEQINIEFTKINADADKRQIDLQVIPNFADLLKNKIKVLNNYGGVGGNRKRWQNVEVTMVEQNAEIAEQYQKFFPDDTVIVGDAHQYLLEHFAEFPIKWGSPPCPTHSKINYSLKGQGIYRYPDMKLYEEIIFLQHFDTGLWVIENVQPYYKPLVEGKRIGRHLFWSNFQISDYDVEYKIESDTNRKPIIREAQIPELLKLHGLEDFKIKNKRQVLRNCVLPDLGLHVFNCALAELRQRQPDLFYKDESKIAV
jgi:DNA (cytosine-5)-methyltransferase 1